MSTAGKAECPTLRGIAARRGGRHAFVHERVIELIARETKRNGSTSFRKNDLVQHLGCCERSLDRAVTRLRREGLIVTTPVFNENGAQLGNEYRATEEGLAFCEKLKKAEKPVKKAAKKEEPEAE